jgi:DNA-binding GntR family transcriptional regulator
MKKLTSTRNLMKIFSLIAILITMNSCVTSRNTDYYKVTLKPKYEDDLKFGKLVSSRYNKFAMVNPENGTFVHFGDDFMQMKNTRFIANDGKISVSGDLSEVTDLYRGVYNRMKLDPRGSFPYYETDKIRASNQFHFYIESINEVSEQIKFELNDLIKVEHFQTAKISRKVAGGVAAAAIITPLAIIGGGVVLIIAACNCPHVYVLNGDSYQYTTSMFTGAIAPNLERSDFKKMPDFNEDSENYSIIVKNEEHEVQHIDLAELVVAYHSSDVSVLQDQKGNMFTISEPFEPAIVINEYGENLTQTLSDADDVSYSFNEESVPGLQSVYATFKLNQSQSIEPKLLLTLKNSSWSGFVHDELKGLFGNKLDEYREMNSSKKREKLETELANQGVLLKLAVRSGDEWVDLENINLIGDVDYNQIVSQIPAEYVENGEVNIKLSSGFNFWELDYIAMDVSEEKEIIVEKLSPPSIEQTNKLVTADEEYVLLNLDDEIEINFEGLQHHDNMRRTIFLHSRGYYVSNEVGVGKMNKKALFAIKKESGLSEFSRGLYLEFKKYMAAGED